LLEAVDSLKDMLASPGAGNAADISTVDANLSRWLA
jgi:hypothetical protein